MGKSSRMCGLRGEAPLASDWVNPGSIVLFGDEFEVDFRSYQLRRAGRVVKLERIPMELLLLLIEQRGELVSREQIVDKIWGKGVFLDTDASINAAVRKIRMVLRDDPESPKFVQTITGRGYRFIAEVTLKPATPATPVAVLPAAPAVESVPPLIADLNTAADQPSMRRWVAVSAAAIALLVISLVLVGNRSGVFSGSSASDPIRMRKSVAVLGFRNLSQNADNAWLSTALTEMLNTELAAGQKVRVIPSETVTHMRSELALQKAESYSPATLQKIRSYLGADMLVIGSYLASTSETGTRLRVDLQLQDAKSGDIIAATSQYGAESELADIASGGGAALRKSLGIPELSGVEVSSIRASVPSGTVSARFYSEGLARLQNFDADGARTLLQNAIDSDPGNAMSHSAMAEALKSLGYDKLAQAEAKKSFDLSTGLAQEERLLIEGRYRDLIHDRSGSIEAYRKLHKLFPDDVDSGLRLASAQTRAGLGHDALETVAQLRRIPEIGERDARIDLEEAAAWQSLGNPKECLPIAEAAVARADAQGSHLLMADALNLQGWALHRLGKRDESLEVYKKAQQLSAGSGNGRLAASLLHGIAITLRDQGKYVEAKATYEEALQEFRQLGAVWDVASCTHNLGILYYDEGNLQAARKHLEEALRIQRSIDDDRGVAADLDDLSNVFASMGDLTKAVKMKQEALELFRRTGDRRGEAITFGALGFTQWLKGDLAAANESFERSLAIKKEIGDKSGQGYAWFGMSMVLMEQDRLPEALSAAKQAMVIRDQLKDETHGAESKVQLAQIAMEQDNAPEAERMAREAAAVLDQGKLTSVTSDCYGVLARALAAQNKFDEARAASQRSVAAAKQTGDLPTKMNAEVSSAAALEKKQTDSIRALKTAQSEAKRNGFVGFDLKARFQLARLDVGNSAAARARMGALRDEARQKGYLLVARQADAVMKEQKAEMAQLARK